MLKGKTLTSMLFGALAIILTFTSPVFAKFTASDAAELDAKAEATLAAFKAETAGADAILSNAKGVLVCPKIVKAGLGVGGETGRCVLVSGSAEKIYYSSLGIKTGFIAGIESHSMMLVMNTDEALAKFTSGKREWELGVDASVAVAKLGAGGDIDTTNLKKDIVSFIFGQKGLIADVTWEGSRFKKLDVE